MSPPEPLLSPKPALFPKQSPSPHFHRPRLQTCTILLTLLSTLLLSLLLLHRHHPLFLFCDYHPPAPYSHIPTPLIRNASTALSHAIATQRLLFIIPRPDGLSNQRITLAQGLHCARLNNRVAVLPPIFSNSRYGSRVLGPFPFADYFDVNALKALNISFTTHDALDDDCVLYVSPKEVKNRVVPVLKRKAVPASPEAIKKERCVTQDICADMNWTAEFGVYSNYTTGQGFKVARSAKFRLIRSAIQPSPIVTQLAALIKRKLPRVYNAVHIRRTDFRSKCKMSSIDCVRFGRESVDPSAEYIIERVLQMPRRALFVSTEDPKWARTQLRPRFAELGIRVVLGEEVRSCWKDRVDVRSMADQVVCVGAERFVGNRFSSFSADIVQARILENRTTENGTMYLR